MKEQYYDMMAIHRKYASCAAFFITITSNPADSDILQNVSFDDYNLRPDIECRAFRLKLDEIKSDIYDKGILGIVVAHVHVIEFTSAGNPHAHMVVFTREQDIPNTADKINRVISAELPDSNTQPILFSLVQKFMIHGPCGQFNTKRKCMSNEKKACDCHYPKKFCEETKVKTESYSDYKRPNNKRIVYKYDMNRQVVRLDNRWVVPYNPYLLMKYQCHINVEAVLSSLAIKYINGYMTQFDKNGIDVEITENEIQNYLNARVLTPRESAWHLFKFPMQGKSHTIERMHLHLPDQETIFFDEDEDIAEKLFENRASKLTEWFVMNNINEESRQYLYCEFGTHYRWFKRKWQERKVNRLIFIYFICYISEYNMYFNLDVF